MRKKIRVPTPVLALLFLPTILLAADQASIRVPPFEAIAGDEFPELCKTLRIPCGWERLPSEPPISGTAVGLKVDKWSSLDAILTEIQKHYPRYIFSWSEGVLTMTPRPDAAKSEKYKSPLNSVTDTQIVEGTLEASGKKICNLGGMPPGNGTHLIVGSGIMRRAVTMRLTGLSVRAELNRLVSTDGHSMWVYYPTELGPAARGKRRKWSDDGLEVFQWAKD